MWTSEKISFCVLFLIVVVLSLLVYGLTDGTPEPKKDTKGFKRVEASVGNYGIVGHRQSPASAGDNVNRSRNLEDLRSYLNGVKEALRPNSRCTFPYTPVLSRLKDDIKLDELLERALSEYVGNAAKERELFSILLEETDIALKECILYGLNARAPVIDKLGLDKTLIALLNNNLSKEELCAIIGSCVLNIAWGPELRKADIAFLGMNSLNSNEYSTELAAALLQTLVKEEDDAIKSRLKEFLLDANEYVMRSSIREILDIRKFEGMENWRDAVSADANYLADAALYCATDSYLLDSLANVGLLDKVRTLLSDLSQKDETTQKMIISTLIWSVSRHPADDETKACSLILMENLKNLEPLYEELARIEIYRIMQNDPSAADGFLKIVRESNSPASILLAAKYYAEALPEDQRMSAIRTLTQLRPDKSAIFEVLNQD